MKKVRLITLLFGASLLAATLGMTLTQAHAVFLGHNFRGDYGLLSGTQPDPGLYLSALYLRYDADKILNSDGDPIGPDPSQPGSIEVNSYAASLWYVSDFKLLGANYGFMLFPALTNNALEAPLFGLDESTNTGFTDLYFQPINLGWHTERADFIAGFGVFAPTGRYEPGASDNLGLGMWSFEVSAGTTIYFDEARTWHFATTAFYETHTKKRNTDIRVGDILTFEGGLGKSFLGGALTVGVSYYAQFQMTYDDVGPDIEPLLKGRKLSRQRVFGVGPEITVPIMTSSTLYGLLNARFLWETGARSTLEGTTFTIGVTFPIPSVSLQ
jgi:hypothetical protein